MPPSHPPLVPLAFLLAVLVVLAAPAAAAPETLRVPALFSDHMVLQRGIEAPLWGQAPAGSTVRVTREGDSLRTVELDSLCTELRSQKGSL